MALPEIQKKLETLLHSPGVALDVVSEIPSLIEALFREDPAFADEYATNLLSQFTLDSSLALSRSARLYGTYEAALSFGPVVAKNETMAKLPPMTETEIKKAIQDLKNPKGWWFGQKTKNQLQALEVLALAGATCAPYFDDIYFLQNTKGEVGLATRKILVHLVSFLNPQQLEVLAKRKTGESLTNRLLRTMAVVTLGRLREAEAKQLEVLPPKKARLTRSDVIRKILMGDKNLDGEDLSEVNLSYMDPLEMSFNQANLTGAILTGTDLRKVQIDEKTILTSANLQGVKLTATQLMTLKQGGSRLGLDGFHDFRGVILDSEDLSDADMAHMDLREVQFFGTRLTGANIFNLKISAEHLGMIILFGKRAQNWVHDFCGINLSGEKLPDQAIGSIDLKNAHIAGTVFNRNWVLSVIKEGSRLDEQGFHDLAGISLAGADLRKLDLSKVNLKKANLTNARMDLKTMQSIIIAGSRLEENGLHDFTGVDLEHVDLRGIDLSQLNLEKASLRNARLDLVALLSLIKSGSHIGADGLLDLAGVNLQGLDLRGSGIDLKPINLKQANLAGVKLSAMQVQQLIGNKSRLGLRFHDFSGVDLTGENLQSLPVHQMDFSGVKLDLGQISFRNLLYHVLVKLNFAQPNPELDQQVEWGELKYLSSLVDYKEGVLLFGIRPDISDTLQRNINRLINLAILITRIMDETEFGAFRKAIHAGYYQDHHILISDYLAWAKKGLSLKGRSLSAENKRLALAYLEEMLPVNSAVYQGKENMKSSPLFLDAAIKKGVGWPDDQNINSLEQLSALSIKLREYAEINFKQLSQSRKFQLTRLTNTLSHLAYTLTALENKNEVDTAIQAKKMGVAIHVLYGAGFGDPSWIYVGNLLMQLAQKWDQTPLEKNRSNLHRFGVLALKMVEEVIDFYHAQFDSLLKKQGPGWGWDQKTISEFTRSVYRSTALFQLASHLESLKVKPGSAKTVGRVMEILSRGEPPHIPYLAYFFDRPKAHEFADDVRVVGGKGRGLVLLTHHEDEVGYKVPRGFTLPTYRLSGDRLASDKIKLIMEALAELEQSTGLSFEKGTLKVSVRSGAAVSMPGMMDTILNVGSIAEVIKAVQDVYNSWDTPRSKAFRKLNGIPARWGSAVNIVVMVPATSGAGVAASFSQDGRISLPQIHYGKGKTGEEVVKGHSIVHDSLPDGCEAQLQKAIRFWENKLGHPVELEFTIDEGVLYLLQLRTAHLDYEDEIKWVAAQVFQKFMTREKGIDYLGGIRKLAKAKNTTQLDLKGNEIVIAKNARGSGIPYVGRIGFDEADIASILQGGAQAVYVTDSPDAAESAQPAMQAGAVISSGGNVLSHLAGVAKTMRLPHISGVGMTMGKKIVTFLAGKSEDEAFAPSSLWEEIPATLKKGDTVSLDPRNGRIFYGNIPIIKAESVVANLIDWLLTSEPSGGTPDNSGGGHGSGGGDLSPGMEHLVPMEPMGLADAITVESVISETPSPAFDILPFAGSLPVITGAPMTVLNLVRM